MVRIAIFALLVVVVYFLIRSYLRPSEPRKMGVSTEMVQDPNCEIYLPRIEAIEREIAGITHCFCSEKCADVYQKKSS